VFHSFEKKNDTVDALEDITLVETARNEYSAQKLANPYNDPFKNKFNTNNDITSNLNGQQNKYEH